jgi:AraC-like DNA-binding protein
MDPTSASVPVQRGDVETAEPGLADEFICRAYTDHRVRMRDPAPDFLFRARCAATAEVSVDEVTYRAAVEATSDPFDSVAVLSFRTGRYTVRHGDDLLRLGPGDAVLLPDREFDAAWDRTELHLTQFSAITARRMAARLGTAPGEFRFTGLAPISPERNRHWLSATAYLRDAFAGPEPAVAHPLLHRIVVDLVAAAALAVFPNTTMTSGYTPGPGRVDPKAVRRAVEFVDSHADRPITCEDIAGAAGLSVRGLQAAFAKHRDTTPTGYLRRVRLDRAHHDLRNGDRSRGDTVEAIARRWGFPNPGRFAAEYRKVYGESPGHTLRS